MAFLLRENTVCFLLLGALLALDRFRFWPIVEAGTVSSVVFGVDCAVLRSSKLFSNGVSYGVNGMSSCISGMHPSCPNRDSPDQTP